MNSKLIEYLNKTRNGKKDNIRAILFSEDTFTYYYLFDINTENKKCVMMCEPINASRPYCELYSVYLEEIQYYIGPYQIVDGQRQQLIHNLIFYFKCIVMDLLK